MTNCFQLFSLLQLTTTFAQCVRLFLIFELIVTPRSICVGTGNPSGSTEVLPCQGHTDVGTPLMQTGLSGSADVLVGIWTAHTPAPAIGK